jgi:hypothetical protein
MSVKAGYGQRRIKVTPEVIEAWLVYGNAVKTDLPEDARFIRLWPKDAGDCYILVFESSEWDELAEGEEIPLITLTVERIEE